MKKNIVFLMILLFPFTSYAETICFETKKKSNIDSLSKPEETCIEVDDSNPVIVGGGGDCGGSAKCGNNNNEVMDLIKSMEQEKQGIFDKTPNASKYKSALKERLNDSKEIKFNTKDNIFKMERSIRR